MILSRYRDWRYAPLVYKKAYFEGVGPAAPPVPLPGKTFSLLKNEIDSILPDASEAQRGSVDAIYTDLTDAWQKGQGSGAVSQKVLDAINVTPEMRAAFNNNPYLAEKCDSDHLERDRDLASEVWHDEREKIYNAYARLLPMVRVGLNA